MRTHAFYRQWVDSELTGFGVSIGQSDVFVLADKEFNKEAEESILRHRSDIEGFLLRYPDFLTSLTPIRVRDDGTQEVPEIVKSMLAASEKAGVGPMAGVAGAIAEHVGKDLLALSREVIVENGGDIFIKSLKDRVFGIFAGGSPLSGKIGIVIKAGDTPLGVATSSGTVGHSLSFGNADAVSVIAKDAALADAAATAVCNRVKTEEDMTKALKYSKSIEDVMGCVIIYGKRIGSIGAVEITGI